MQRGVFVSLCRGSESHSQDLFCSWELSLAIAVARACELSCLRMFFFLPVDQGSMGMKETSLSFGLSRRSRKWSTVILALLWETRLFWSTRQPWLWVGWGHISENSFIFVTVNCKLFLSQRILSSLVDQSEMWAWQIASYTDSLIKLLQISNGSPCYSELSNPSRKSNSKKLSWKRKKSREKEESEKEKLARKDNLWEMKSFRSCRPLKSRWKGAARGQSLNLVRVSIWPWSFGQDSMRSDIIRDGESAHESRPSVRSFLHLFVHSITCSLARSIDRH